MEEVELTGPVCTVSLPSRERDEKDTKENQPRNVTKPLHLSAMFGRHRGDPYRFLRVSDS